MGTVDSNSILGVFYVKKRALKRDRIKGSGFKLGGGSIERLAVAFHSQNSRVHVGEVETLEMGITTTCVCPQFSQPLYLKENAKSFHFEAVAQLCDLILRFQENLSQKKTLLLCFQLLVCFCIAATRMRLKVDFDSISIKMRTFIFILLNVSAISTTVW